jgi:hypothetical protein
LYKPDKEDKEMMPSNSLTAKKLFFLILFFQIWIAPGIAISQEDAFSKSVKVIGVAEIQGKNVEQAREKAISDGLTSAVEQAALETFPTDALADNFQKLSEILQTKPDKFVQNYKVLAEYGTGKIYRIMLDVAVFTDKLKAEANQFPGMRETASADTLKEKNLQPSQDDMREAVPEDIQKNLPQDKTDTAGTGLIGNESSSMPSILFLVSEQNLEDNSPRYWWGGDSSYIKAFSETAMSEEMRKKGFTVVTHGYFSAGSDKKIAITSQPELDNKEAVKIGSRLQADLVVVGKSVVYKVSDETGGNSSFNGTVSARVLRTDSGEEIASTLQTAVRKNTDEDSGSREALLSAGEISGAELASQIAKAWLGEEPEVSRASSPGLLKQEKDTVTSQPEPRPQDQEKDKAGGLPGVAELHVTGISNLGNFMRFRKVLSETPEIKDMKVYELKSDEATLIVNFQGDTKSLADILKSAEFKLFTVAIRDISQNALNIDLVPKD